MVPVSRLKGIWLSPGDFSGHWAEQEVALWAHGEHFSQESDIVLQVR